MKQTALLTGQHSGAGFKGSKLQMDQLDGQSRQSQNPLPSPTSPGLRAFSHVEKLSRPAMGLDAKKKFVIHFGSVITAWNFNRSRLTTLEYLRDCISRKRQLHSFNIYYKDSLGDMILVLDEDDFEEILFHHKHLYVV